MTRRSKRATSFARPAGGGTVGRVDLSTKSATLQGMMSWVAANPQPAYVPANSYTTNGLIDIPAGSDILFTGAGTVLPQDLHIMAFRLNSNSHTKFENGWRIGAAGVAPLAKRTFTNAEAVGFMIGDTATIRPHDIYVDFGDLIVEAPGNNAMFMYRHSNNITMVGKLTGLNTPADCFHITGGCYNVDLSGTTLTSIGAGDDMFANVSYTGDSSAVTNVHWGTCIGRNQRDGGRGFSVVGGVQISAVSIDLDGTTGASIYIAAEISYDTFGVDDVQLPNVVAKNSNTQSIHNAACVFYNSMSSRIINNAHITGTITPKAGNSLFSKTGSYPVTNCTVNGQAV